MNAIKRYNLISLTMFIIWVQAAGALTLMGEREGGLINSFIGLYLAYARYLQSMILKTIHTKKE